MKLTKEERQRMIDIVNKGLNENESPLMSVEEEEKQLANPPGKNYLKELKNLK